MNKIDSTIDYYNKNAQSFYDETIGVDMSFWRDKFISHLPSGGRILDAGCGSGRDSKAFIKEGYSIVAFDASREMCKRASELIGQEVWQMKFEEMSFDDEFDGIWACASLLHICEKDLPEIINRIRQALKNQGILYASFKYGEGETQRGERRFIDFTEESIKNYMEKKGFEILDSEITADFRPGREDEKWTNIIAIKR